MKLLAEISPGQSEGGMLVDEVHSPKIRAKFPGSDGILSVAEVTRCKLMLLGLEVVSFGKLLDVIHDEFGETLSVGREYGVVVRLPDGSGFEVKDGRDIAELRAVLNAPREPAATD